jgi:hypothetical protein
MISGHSVYIGVGGGGRCLDPQRNKSRTRRNRSYPSVDIERMDTDLSGEDRLGQARLPELPHQNLDLGESPPPQPSQITSRGCHPLHLPDPAPLHPPWGPAYPYDLGSRNVLSFTFHSTLRNFLARKNYWLLNPR